MGKIKRDTWPTFSDQDFHEITNYDPVTPGRRAKRAGELLAMCIELESPFVGDMRGWRIRVEPLHYHRIMIAQDLGL